MKQRKRCSDSWNPSSWEAEAGGLSWVQVQPGLQNEILPHKGKMSTLTYELKFCYNSVHPGCFHFQQTALLIARCLLRIRMPHASFPNFFLNLCWTFCIWSLSFIWCCLSEMGDDSRYIKRNAFYWEGNTSRAVATMKSLNI